MKQFSLEEFKKNPTRNIVTRDGRAKVRIICTDAKREYPIIALLTAYDGSEVIYEYKKNGVITDDGECNLDLFFDAAKKSGWVNVYKIADTDQLEASCIFSTKEQAEFYRGDNPKYVATTKIEWEE